MKQVTMESSLLQRGKDYATELKANFGAVNLHDVATLIGDLVSQLEAKIGQLSAMTEQRDAVVAEAAQMRQVIDGVTNLDNEPQYDETSVGLGIETREITDRYEAAKFGWDLAMEAVYGEVIPCAEEVSFPTIDTIRETLRAEARVDAFNYAADSVRNEIICLKERSPTLKEMACLANEFDSMARQLRESKGANHE